MAKSKCDDLREAVRQGEEAQSLYFGKISNNVFDQSEAAMNMWKEVREEIHLIEKFIDQARIASARPEVKRLFSESLDTMVGNAQAYSRKADAYFDVVYDFNRIAERSFSILKSSLTIGLQNVLVKPLDTSRTRLSSARSERSKADIDISDAEAVRSSNILLISIDLSDAAFKRLVLTRLGSAIDSYNDKLKRLKDTRKVYNLENDQSALVTQPNSQYEFALADLRDQLNNCEKKPTDFAVEFKLATPAAKSEVTSTAKQKSCNIVQDPNSLITTQHEIDQFEKCQQDTGQA